MSEGNEIVVEAVRIVKDDGGGGGAGFLGIWGLGGSSRVGAIDAGRSLFEDVGGAAPPPPRKRQTRKSPKSS